MTRHFENLSETQLSQVIGGKINWGSVIGNCAGGAIIGIFGGVVTSVSGCVIGASSALIDGL